MQHAGPHNGAWPCLKHFSTQLQQRWEQGLPDILLRSFRMWDIRVGQQHSQHTFFILRSSPT